MKQMIENDRRIAMIFEKQVVAMYKGMLHTRCDDVETVHYFSSEDFPGLKKESRPFKALAGNTLQGYIYSYDDAYSDKLIVFDHGFGGGHRAYMREIEMLCRHKYTVFAYDHTGCMESGGDSPKGLAQSLCDLDDCITMLKASEDLGKRDLSVIGHSWGGFSTLNITALHPEISHIVAISGFVSVEEMIKTFFSGILKLYRKAVFQLEKDSNPRFSEYNAVTTLSSSNTKALLIYSENDTMCRRYHYDLLNKALGAKENISLMLLKNKGHNPNYTEEAVKYLGEFSAARTKLLKSKTLSRHDKAQFVSSFDFKKMTEQDEEVWKLIFEHLEK